MAVGVAAARTGLTHRLRHEIVEVWDSSSQPPSGPAPVGHPCGYFTLSTGGKVVWTAIRYPLPKRTPSAFSYPPVSHEAANQPNLYSNDLATIQRVRAGLELSGTNQRRPNNHARYRQSQQAKGRTGDRGQVRACHQFVPATSFE